ncbi:MAG: hypothetical protein ACI3ZO_04960 [Candidatus Cryptobacteroides sp.]|nr:hypothetical protein [Bacteroidales bacterium]
MSAHDIFIVICILAAGFVDYSVKKKRLAREGAPKRRFPEIVFPDPGQLDEEAEAEDTDGPQDTDVEGDGKVTVLQPSGSIPECGELERPVVKPVSAPMTFIPESVPQIEKTPEAEYRDDEGQPDRFRINPKDMIVYSALMEPKFKETGPGK